MGICLIIKSGGRVDTSSATATADKILGGYTIYSNDNKVTGSMTNIGNQAKHDSTYGNTTAGQYNFTWDKLTSAGVWAGWHDGTCVITTPSLSDSTQCDMDASWCLEKYTYWKAGNPYTGTMASRGTKSWTMKINGDAVTIESGWHSGSGTVKQSPTVNTNSTAVTMRPTTSNQTLCDSGWYYYQARYCEGASTLAKENIKSGVTIFGITGTYVDTTKQFIIKDGALTSGIYTYKYWYSADASDDGTDNWSTGSTESSLPVKFSNNTSYALLYTSSYSRNVTNETYWVLRGAIGNKVSMTGWTATGRIKGALRADLYVQSTNSASTYALRLWIVVTPGTANKKNQYGSTMWQTMSPTPGVNSYITYSQSSVSGAYLNSATIYGNQRFNTSMSQGDFMMQHTWQDVAVYCKNLWFDTSVSIS